MSEPDANGWYPIASRPWDESYVILYSKNRWWTQGVWSPEKRAYITGRGVRSAEFFWHWRPSFKPPVEFEEKGDG